MPVGRGLPVHGDGKSAHQNARRRSQLVLEINDKHPRAEKLFALLKDDPETLKKYTKILYDQARLISGLDVQNPTALADSIVDMML